MDRKRACGHVASEPENSHCTRQIIGAITILFVSLHLSCLLSELAKSSQTFVKMKSTNPLGRFYNTKPVSDFSADFLLDSCPQGKGKT